MTVFREFNVDGPSFTLGIEENGEDERRTLTATLEVNQIRNPNAEPVILRFIFKNLTSDNLRCVGDQMQETAQIAEDDRGRLAPGRNHRIGVREAPPRPDPPGPPRTRP